MKIIIANDHGALDLKFRLVKFLESNGHKVNNMGTDTMDSVDYPDIAEKACSEFLKGGYDFGILCCGTGIGISIAANKIDGIRAALPQNAFGAEMAKEHNNANFIVFGGRISYQEKVEDILLAYMNSKFAGGRHQTRLDKVTQIESR